MFMNIRSSSVLTGSGIISAIAASLCCITPLIALLAGTGTVAANFSWIEPARPYLVGLSLLVLALAWYLKLRKAKTTEEDCNCESPMRKNSFLQSKFFLGVVTVFALVMISFPLYAKVFYSSGTHKTVATVNNKQQVKFRISGMGCEDCAAPVNLQISKLPGVISFSTSYTNQSSVVSFDRSQLDVKTIEAAINRSGCKVKGYELLNSAPSADSCSQRSGKNCCRKN
jgi:mercuric ion transport protein